MNKLCMNCCLGLLTLLSASICADTDEAAPAIAAAEKGCIEAAQKRYGVAAGDVSRGRDEPKWESGLGGYQVDLLIKKKNGKAAQYSCVAKPNGSFRFFAG